MPSHGTTVETTAWPARVRLRGRFGSAVSVRSHRYATPGPAPACHAPAVGDPPAEITASSDAFDIAVIAAWTAARMCADGLTDREFHLSSDEDTRAWARLGLLTHWAELSGRAHGRDTFARGMAEQLLATNCAGFAAIHAALDARLADTPYDEASPAGPTEHFVALLP